MANERNNFGKKVTQQNRRPKSNNKPQRTFKKANQNTWLKLKKQKKSVI